MDGYELTDFEWNVIQPLLPNKPRGVPRVDDRRVLNGLGAANGGAVACSSGRVWPAHDLLQPLRTLAQGRGLGPCDGRYDRGLRR
jgi:hypothetical protein